jgi:hypothetical protein
MAESLYKGIYCVTGAYAMDFPINFESVQGKHDCRLLRRPTNVTLAHKGLIGAYNIRRVRK